jgi:hypothetical protein
VNLVRHTTSLGGVESAMERRAAIAVQGHLSVAPAPQRRHRGHRSPALTLLRVSLLLQRFSPENIPHLAANPPALIAPELRISLPHPLDGTLLAPPEYARSVATLYANLFDMIWRWRTRD